jgi:transposase-like protein
VSKARLVITAVVVEGRSQSEVAREYGVSQGWISRLVARYRLEGEGAFAPRSRRPLTSPTRLPQPTIELIVTLRNDLLSKGLDTALIPSPGTYGITTASPCRSIPSTATCAPRAW